MFLSRVASGSIFVVFPTGSEAIAGYLAVNGYRVEQDAGYRTIVDVLNALNELSEAEVFEAQLAYTRDKSTYMLVAALARLDVGGTVVAGR